MSALLAAAGYPGHDDLLGAVDAWRRDRLVPAQSIANLGDTFIAQLDACFPARAMLAPRGP